MTLGHRQMEYRRRRETTEPWRATASVPYAAERSQHACACSQLVTNITAMDMLRATGDAERIPLRESPVRPPPPRSTGRRPETLSSGGNGLREPDPWQLGNVKEFPDLERACGRAAPICQHTHRETHSRPLLTAKVINAVAGRLPPSAERSVHPKVLVSQGIFVKGPSQTPSGVMSSGASTPPPVTDSRIRAATSPAHRTKSIAVQWLDWCPLLRGPLGVYFPRAGVCEAFRAASDRGLGSAFHAPGMRDQSATASMRSRSPVRNSQFEAGIPVPTLMAFVPHTDF